MKIIIKETSETKNLSIIDPKSGVDYTEDFIGNAGGFLYDQFKWDDENRAYWCDQATFDWWDRVVNDNQLLEYRIHELVKEHGSDAVYEAIDAAGSVDLEDHAANVNQALDEAFASAD